MIRIINRVISLAKKAEFILRFALGGPGAEYGLGVVARLRLALRVIRTTFLVKSLSSWQQHLLMVEDILRVPRTLPGDVIECGCYNGASTVNLSLACALTGRRLFVCDSFEGLPDPPAADKFDVFARDNKFYEWQKGDFASEGSLEGVRERVRRFGAERVCRFVKGYFNRTLPQLEAGKLVLVFEDADIASSVEDCLRSLWPKLQEGCKFYSHEPWSANVVALFYDKEWWLRHFHSEPPGFFGSGQGLPYCAGFTEIGYAVKWDLERVKREGEKISHTGSKGHR